MRAHTPEWNALTERARQRGMATGKVRAQIWADMKDGPRPSHLLIDREFASSDTKERLQLMLLDLAASMSQPVGWGMAWRFRIHFTQEEG